MRPKSALPMPLRPAIALLVGLLATATLLVAAPAEATTARSISLTGTPAVAVAGTTMTVSGRVTGSPRGTLILIERKSASTWVTVARLRTRAKTGAYSVRLTLPATRWYGSDPLTYSYRALAPRTTRLRQATSRAVAVSALHPRTVTITAGSKAITPGSTVGLSGTVAPYTLGAEVHLQRLSGSTWTTVRTALVHFDGTYATGYQPTGTGTYRASVDRWEGTAASTSGSVTVIVAATPVVDTTTLPTALNGYPYSATLKTAAPATGTWSVTGALPAGITLNPTTGRLSGTATTDGSSAFTVTFTDGASGFAASRTLTLVVGTLPTITTTTLPDATRGVAYAQTLGATVGPGTWSVLNLPVGMSVDPQTGVLSGAPKYPATYGLYVTYRVTASDLVAYRTLTLEVGGTPLAITTTSLLDGTTGTAYSAQLTDNGTDGAWTLVQGALPDGLVLSPAGLVAGTPTKTGDYGIRVRFTEASTGTAVEAGLVLHTSAPGSPTITTLSLPAGTVGTPYAAPLATTGTGGLWSVSAGALPPGISLNPATGALSGTPDAASAGDTLFIVKYTTLTSSNTRFLVLHVDAATP